MADPINHMLGTFEGNINPVNSQGLKMYLQVTKEIDEAYDKLDI